MGAHNTRMAPLNMVPGQGAMGLLHTSPGTLAHKDLAMPTQAHLPARTSPPTRQALGTAAVRDVPLSADTTVAQSTPTCRADRPTARPTALLTTLCMGPPMAALQGVTSTQDLMAGLDIQELTAGLDMQKLTVSLATKDGLAMQELTPGLVMQAGLDAEDLMAGLNMQVCVGDLDMQALLDDRNTHEGALLATAITQPRRRHKCAPSRDTDE